MKCEQCEAEFSPHNRLQRFCSKKCNFKSWRTKNREAHVAACRAANNDRYVKLRDARARKLGTPTRCQICGERFSNSKSTHWDHNHGTGEARGWLCARCNLGIGYLGDNPRLIEKAVEYLREHGFSASRSVVS